MISCCTRPRSEVIDLEPDSDSESESDSELVSRVDLGSDTGRRSGAIPNFPSFGLSGLGALLAILSLPNVFSFLGSAAACGVTSSGDEMSLPTGFISSISGKSSSSLSVSLAPPLCSLSLLLPLPLPLSSPVNPSIISISNPDSLPLFFLLPWLPSLSEPDNPCIFSILNSGDADLSKDESTSDGVFSFTGASSIFSISDVADSSSLSPSLSSPSLSSPSLSSPSLSSDKLPSNKL